MKIFIRLLTIALGLFLYQEMTAQNPQKPRKKKHKKESSKQTDAGSGGEIIIDEGGQTSNAPGSDKKNSGKDSTQTHTEKPKEAAKSDVNPSPPAPPIAIDEAGQTSNGKKADPKSGSDSVIKGPAMQIERPKEE